jgi:ATP-dependent Clp protease ATP-binding subunit ClpC
LTDRFGRVTNFTSSVIILTSNLGSERFAKGDIGFSESGNSSSDKDIKAFFRPEFFNRLDNVVQFQPLSKNTVEQITEKELLSISKREGLLSKQIKLLWTKEVTDILSAKGFDKRYGARPLQRTIETLLTSPLAKFLLENPNLKDAEIEIISDESEEFNFKVK